MNLFDHRMESSRDIAKPIARLVWLSRVSTVRHSAEPEKNILTLKGERRFEGKPNREIIDRKFTRVSRFFIPAMVMNIKAEYKDGILKIPRRRKSR
jgi:hypothetical protein